MDINPGIENSLDNLTVYAELIALGYQFVETLVLKSQERRKYYLGIIKDILLLASASKKLYE